MPSRQQKKCALDIKRCFMNKSSHFFKNLPIALFSYENMKKIYFIFHIKRPLTFSDMRTWDLWKFSLETFRNSRISEKLANLLRNLQTSRANNSRIHKISTPKFPGYCFYINTNIYEDFQICISVPLIKFLILMEATIVLKKPLTDCFWK